MSQKSIILLANKLENLISQQILEKEELFKNTEQIRLLKIEKEEIGKELLIERNITEDKDKIIEEIEKQNELLNQQILEIKGENEKLKSEAKHTYELNEYGSKSFENESDTTTTNTSTSTKIINSDSTDIEGELSELKQVNITLQNNYRTLEKDNNELIDRVNELQEQLKNSEVIINSTSTNIQENMANKLSIFTYKSLLILSRRIRRKMSSEIKELFDYKEENDKLITENNKLALNLEEARRTNVRLTQENEQISNNKSESDKIKQLYNDLYDYDVKFERNTHELDRLEKQMIEFENIKIEYTTLESKYSDLNFKYNELMNSFNELNDDYEQTRYELSEQIKERDELIEKLQKQIDFSEKFAVHVSMNNSASNNEISISEDSLDASKAKSSDQSDEQLSNQTSEDDFSGSKKLDFRTIDSPVDKNLLPLTPGQNTPFYTSRKNIPGSKLNNNEYPTEVFYSLYSIKYHL